MEDLGPADNSIDVLIVIFMVSGSTALVPYPEIDDIRRTPKSFSGPAELSIHIREQDR